MRNLKKFEAGLYPHTRSLVGLATEYGAASMEVSSSPLIGVWKVGW